jgi:arsenate reductase
MSDTILFLCPHAAAKSVLAVAAFEQLVTERGIAIRAVAAGTEPDAAPAPAVVAWLATKGIDVSGHIPRLVTAADIREARHTILLGCNINELPVQPDNYEEWNDLPPASENPEATWLITYQHVQRLLEALT